MSRLIVDDVVKNGVNVLECHLNILVDHDVWIHFEKCNDPQEILLDLKVAERTTVS